MGMKRRRVAKENRVGIEFIAFMALLIRFLTHSLHFTYDLASATRRPRAKDYRGEVQDSGSNMNEWSMMT
jgi:hypothetical protein